MRNSRTTIKDAITKVLKDSNIPLSIKAIVELRRHTQGVDFPTASKKKYYQILNDGTYCLIEQSHLFIKEDKKKQMIESDEKRLIATLRATHNEYVKAFKLQLLEQLKEISPDVFEIFCKKLLRVYGFKDLKVTKFNKDGGIDGYGKLKVGISFLNVAVQCKRWKTSTVGRTEIDKFRGAIQGDYEQGIFITTSKFSKEALNATTKKGAVPIILIDGLMIINIMIEKQFGVEIQNMPIYMNALDIALE